MTRILLLGASGQVGSALQRRLASTHELLAPSSAELSLDAVDALTHHVRRSRPELIINAAAYTAVDRAEEDAQRAMAVNARAPEVLAQEAEALGAALIHYSTDYVFDGSKGSPYTESDPTAPLNVYGQSKLAGDTAIQSQHGAYWIFRTTWVYSHTGRNFLLTMRRLLSERDELRVVDDQIGAPTPAEEIAAATVAILAQGGDAPARYIRERAGLYNMSCSGETSWYGFACAIRAHMARAGNPDPARLQPIPGAQYPTPARRPAYSVLDNGRLRECFGVALPDWTVGLERVWREVEAGGVATKNDSLLG